MKKTIIFCTMAIAICMSSFVFGGTAKQVKKSKKITALAYDQASHDSNVKSRDALKEEKEIKTGKNRACAIYVNNHRGYYVDVYIDGYYYGMVGPYGAYTFYPGDGWATIYCETTNGALWWKESGSCYSWNSFNLY